MTGLRLWPAGQASSRSSAMAGVQDGADSGQRLIHRAFEDPADETGDFEQRLAAFRRVRDQIKAYFEEDFVPIVIEAADPAST